MREEVVRFSGTNPKDLPKESRFLLELDKERYVTGNDWHTDKCYFLSAARAAMCAGRRRKSKSGRNAGAGIRRAAKKVKCGLNRGFARMRCCGNQDARKRETR